MDHEAADAERFVGREHELRHLDRMCASARAGQGSVVAVSGEPGIGKTRLCEEIAAHAERSGLRVVNSRCWVEGGAPPLWPWQPIVTQLCGVDAADLLATDSGLDEVDPDRFARFAAVADRLATAAARQPVCLLVDDVHAADPGALLLIRFVARSIRQLPIALVLTRRTGEPDPGTSAARLLAEIETEAVPLVLRRFDDDEATELLGTQGLSNLKPDVLDTLLLVAQGNPLFLRRIAALGPPDEDEALPTALHAAIEQALARLQPETRHILRCAAVLGVAPSVNETSLVTDATSLTVIGAMEEAVGAGLVTVDDTGGFRFTHDLVRTTLDAGLHVDERLDAHARAAAVMVGDGPATAERLARRAYHARIASTRSAADVDLAIRACQEAAAAMVRNLAYEQADSLLSWAVVTYEDAFATTRPARLLLEWAQAALRCGRMTEARQRFDRAADAAQRDGDPVILADAALGLGGHWVNEHRTPVERARVLGLQRAALEGLPDDEVARRCRLRVRLAAEAVFDGGRIEPVLDALDAARRCGNPLALAESLSLSHHALFTAEHTHDRLPLAEELIRVASEAGDGVLSLMGLCWRTVDLFHLGDDRALRSLEELRERAAALANQNLLYYVAAMDVMLLLRQGRLAEAEAAAQHCYELGDSVGEVDTLGYLTAHTVGLRWLQNRDAEVVGLAESVAASPTLIRTEFSLRASAAAILARAGKHRLARAALEALRDPDGFAELPQSSTWLVGMVAIVETAAELGDAETARQVYDLLLPYADLPVIASIGVVCTGSTERSLGIAALTFGDPDLATEHLERAVVANRRLDNRPLTAMAQAELARALQRRGRPGDRERAIELLHQAAGSADDLEMTARAEMWRGELAHLQEDGATTAHDGDDGPVGSRGIFHRSDNRWLVGLDGHPVSIPDLVGMRYLATLLTHPRQSIAAVTLAGHGALDEPVPQELLDDQARETYTARARELAAELAEAEDNNDLGRATRLRTELDALVDQLEAAAGWGNRPRTFADPAERARTSVRKAIKRAIDAIATADEQIGRHLRSAIDTGHTCRYNPDPRVPITWSTKPPEPATPG